MRTTKTSISIEITDMEAFRILCETLDMEFILDEDFDFYPKRFDDEHCCVCYLDGDGDERVIDDRGKLFIALCNVAVNMFPNVHFRRADYIYD